MGALTTWTVSDSERDVFVWVMPTCGLNESAWMLGEQDGANALMLCRGDRGWLTHFAPKVRFSKNYYFCN